MTCKDVVFFLANINLLKPQVRKGKENTFNVSPDDGLNYFPRNIEKFKNYHMIPHSNMSAYESISNHILKIIQEVNNKS